MCNFLGLHAKYFNLQWQHATSWNSQIWMTCAGLTTHSYPTKQKTRHGVPMQKFHTIARYYCYVFSFFKLGKKHRELPLEIQPLIFYSSPL
jgi:hypothetical protein